MRSNQHSWSVCLCRAFKIRVSGLQSLPTSCDMKRSWKYTRAVLVALESASGGFSTPFTEKNIKWTLCQETLPRNRSYHHGVRRTMDMDAPPKTCCPEFFGPRRREPSRPTSRGKSTPTLEHPFSSDAIIIYIYTRKKHVCTYGCSYNKYTRFFFRGTQ